MRSLWITLFACFGIVANAATISLQGQIRDFCAPSISNSCTQLTDFEGNASGLVKGMVGSALSPQGLPIYVGGGLGGTDSGNFARWFVDSPGFNVTTPFSLDLSEAVPGSGIFSYSSSSFFPIDGLLYGNQGRNHNFHFTMHLQGTTTFNAADSFTFTGDDDLWIYVGGKLAVDLGGVHGAVSQTITGADLMLLGLLENTVYGFDVFFAERHTDQSNFNITTSFSIGSGQVPEPPTPYFVLTGALLVAVKWFRRRPASPSASNFQSS